MSPSEQVALPRRAWPEGGAEAMPRPRLADAIAAETKRGGSQREIDVFVVGEVVRVEETGSAQHGCPEQRGAAAHPQHRAVRAMQLPKRQAEVAVARAAEEVHRKTSRIDALSIVKEQGAVEEAELRPDPRCREQL